MGFREEREAVAALYHAAGSALSRPHAGHTNDRSVVVDVTSTIAASATTTLYAVLYLFQGGLAREALACTRTLVEAHIDLSWILLTDSEVRADRFRSSVDNTIHRMSTALRDASATIPEGDRRAPHVARALADVAEATAEIDHDLLAEFGGHGWAPVSIRQRAKDAGLEQSYRLDFAITSAAAHSGGYGTLSSVTPLGGGRLSMGIGPDEPESRLPLKLASVHFVAVWRMAERLLRIDPLAVAPALRRVIEVFDGRRA